VLSDDPRAVRRACLVTSGNLTLDEHPAAIELRRADWNVYLLTTDIAEHELPPETQVGEFHGDGAAEQSDRIRHALERLHREHRFELIVFSGCGGLGARAIQAKRAGLALLDVPLAVYLDGNSQRDREANRRWPSCFAEVETDYLERFAFESADVQCVPDDELTDFVKRNHWNVRADAVKSVADLTPQPPPQFVPRAAPHLHSQSRLHAERGEGEPDFLPLSPRERGLGGEVASASPLITVAIAHHNLGAYFPDTLATLAAQTYTNFELIAIDDGSTDAASVDVFEAMRAKYPTWQFLRQTNAGIGATRNRCLELARGEFFVPVDADNLAKPDMLARFVTAMKRNPDCTAMSCYFLAFDVEAPNLVPDSFLYALRPAGGPHALASIRNVYGDANAIFRTEALRSVRGYEIDRGTSCEDWECFVKLVHAGHKLGVVPDHLFYYRHRAGGFSRSTNWFANHQRALRQFAHAGNLPPAELLTLWTALLGFHQELEHRNTAAPPRRHRFADRVHAALGRVRRLFG
jgi:glycosyltransferase involved in cell wall biosynthesis